MFICYILLLPNEYTWNIGPHCMVSQLSWKVFNINMQKYITAMNGSQNTVKKYVYIYRYVYIFWN